MAAPFDADRIPMANVVVGRLAAFVEGTYGDLPVAVDELPLHVTADAREAAVQRRQIVIGVGRTHRNGIALCLFLCSLAAI